VGVGAAFRLGTTDWRCRRSRPEQAVGASNGSTTLEVIEDVLDLCDASNRRWGLVVPPHVRSIARWQFGSGSFQLSSVSAPVCCWPIGFPICRQRRAANEGDLSPAERVHFPAGGTRQFLTGVLCIGSGHSIGREGPSVQIGAGIASVVARLV
jgi:hypothetical protein